MSEKIEVPPPICSPTVPQPCIVVDCKPGEHHPPGNPYTCVLDTPPHVTVPVNNPGALAALVVVILVLACCVLARRVYEGRK